MMTKGAFGFKAGDRSGQSAGSSWQYAVELSVKLIANPNHQKPKAKS